MHHLSGKEKKELKNALPLGYEVDKKDKITRQGDLLYKDDEPYLIILEGKYLPHLKSLSKDALKRVEIDHGAVPFLLKGADMMRPGITFIDSGFDVDDVLVICDEVKKIPLGLGFALMNSEDMQKQENGKSIKVFHYFKDSYY